MNVDEQALKVASDIIDMLRPGFYFGSFVGGEPQVKARIQVLVHDAMKAVQLDAYDEGRADEEKDAWVRTSRQG